MNNILNFINTYDFKKPKLAIILGSGLNSFVKKIKNKTVIKYAEIPGLVKTSVKGHNGELIFGEINGIPILCASGRFHFYEGHSFEKVSTMIDIINGLNVKLCIITNSSGCLNLKWNLGSFMLANKFIDYSFMNSASPHFFKIEPNKYFETLLNIAKNENLEINVGTYTFTTGPSYETPAEIKDIINLGGNAVGMSTFPEFLKCKELDIQPIIISCLTNYGAGLIKNKEVKHEDVLKNAKKHKEQFNRLIIQFIENT